MMELTSQERRTLLSIARDAISAALSGKQPDPQITPSAALVERAGAFVTLEIHRKLRGCVGFIQSDRPLAETVREAAVSAALHDNRFEPLSIAEMNNIRIEISVLTPMKKVERPEEIVPGKHGLVVERGYHRGLLLPQVATEYHWDRETFLEQTCIKAGLERHAWKKSDTTIYAFSALVFGEEETAQPGSLTE